jgi:hypothetical protein
MITSFNPNFSRARYNTVSSNRAMTFEAKFKQKDIQNIIDKEDGPANGLVSMARAGHYTREENAEIVRKLLKEHGGNPWVHQLVQIFNIK